MSTIQKTLILSGLFLAICVTLMIVDFGPHGPLPKAFRSDSVDTSRAVTCVSTRYVEARDRIWERGGNRQVRAWDRRLNRFLADGWTVVEVWPRDPEVFVLERQLPCNERCT